MTHKQSSAETAELEPGWLMRTCHEAHIDVMRDNSPSAVKHLGIEPRATDTDAAELAAKMAVRFEAWIGKPITDFLSPAPPQEVPDAADAARYRYLKEHSSYYYAEGYDPPTPREFGIVWEHQDSTPDRPSMDWLIDQEIEAKRLEALEDEAAEAEEDASTLSRPEGK